MSWTHTAVKSRCVFELTTHQRHGGIFQHFLVDRPENQFFFFLEHLKSILKSLTIERVLFRGMGIS